MDTLSETYLASLPSPPSAAAILLTHLTPTLVIPPTEPAQQHTSDTSRTTSTSTSTPDPRPPFTQIGLGFCGEVWSDSMQALKRSWAPLAQQAELRNDASRHPRIYQAFSSTACLVPRYGELVEAHSGWWDTHGTRLPRSEDPRCSYHERTPVLVSERVRPLPASVRAALVALFCPEGLRAAVGADARNRDCLARVYLGLRGLAGGREHSRRGFSLRNFPLTLDKIERLGLDERLLAGVNARALAVLHWEVGTDARDVEFVLGRSRAGGAEYSVKGEGGNGGLNVRAEEGYSPAGLDAISGNLDPGVRVETDSGEESSMSVLNEDTYSLSSTTSIWLLDFNQCAPITMDKNGCIKAAAAFLQNDPYYPRPGISADSKLWDFFVHEYIACSAEILQRKYPDPEDDEIHRLPMCFVERVVEMVQAQRATQALPVVGPPKGAVQSLVGGRKKPVRKGKAMVVDLESLRS